MSAETAIQKKMESAGQSDAAIRAFLFNYRKLVAGETGLMPESALEPVRKLARFDDLPAASDRELIGQTVMIKLNGGLGTSMGLDQAKTLLPVKHGLNFLDLIARQVLHLRERGPLQFLLMNSFSTSDDTMEFLSAYPALGDRDELEFLQSKVPKIDANTLEPAVSSDEPTNEWCPPGHGDIYGSLLGSGKLTQLVARGVKYAFISNSDNLGATPDLAILEYFAAKDASFMMEVTRRTEADRKGGHLAGRRADGRLVLRESAQCRAEDREVFQDVERYRYFNTNNLWFRLDRLQEVLESQGGVFPLPIIRNEKTLDPKDSGSPKVFQLETAMGAAIEEFPDALALEVPRSRFAPVKKTDDLMVLRSDACAIRPDWTLGLVKERAGVPPAVQLDKAYKLVGDYERLVKRTPGLLEARSLTIHGRVSLWQPVEIKGEVTISNRSGEVREMEGGVYENTEVEL